jgi:virginiamycin B lyase
MRSQRFSSVWFLRGAWASILGLLLAAFFGLSSNPTQAGPAVPPSDPPAVRRPAGITTFPVPHALIDITAGPDGNLWATTYCASCGSLNLARITLQGAVTEYPLVAASGAPYYMPIARGADGNLWIGVSSTLFRYVIATGTVTAFPVSIFATVADLTSGADGNLWLATGTTVTRCTTAGACVPFARNRTDLYVYHIAAGPDGNVWFPQTTDNTGDGVIGRITPAGVITDYNLPCCPQPFAVTGGPDGNVWFTQIGAVGRITSAGAVTLFPDANTYAGAAPAITTGADGNLWFTHRDGQFARLTPQGTLDTYGEGGTGEIVSAADGTLWMLNPASVGVRTDVIVRVNLNDGTPLPTAIPTAVPSVQPLPTFTPTLMPTPTLTPAGTPAACPATWADVPSSSGFYAPVTNLACRGIVSGYPCGGVNPQTGQPEPCTGGADAPASSPPYYRPGNWVSRGQAAKIIALSAGLGGRASRQSFADVPATSPFFTAVEALAAAGLANGYRCGASGEPCDDANRPYFRPSTSITRGQLAKLIGGAAGYSTVPPGQLFADVPATNGFYGWVQQVGSRGIIGGYACGGVGEPCDAQNRPYYRPNGAATRAQTAKIDVGVFP